MQATLWSIAKKIGYRKGQVMTAVIRIQLQVQRQNPGDSASFRVISEHDP
jgi:hypothetical protein